MRVLISNDDGIDAPGLAQLVQAARRLSDDVWIVAPDGNRSGYGHGISLRRRIEVRQRAPQTYTCTGTPADCVIAAQAWLFRHGQRPDLVLSGINEGRNVAEDIAYSGTMAVAREATLWGIPAISLSRPRSARPGPADVDWLAARLLQCWQTRAQWALDGHWLNINLPARLPAALRAARSGRDKIANEVAVHAQDGQAYACLEPLPGRRYLAQPGDENDCLAAGHASVTRPGWQGCAEVPDAVWQDATEGLKAPSAPPSAL